jgi:hypothetical protein
LAAVEVGELFGLAGAGVEPPGGANRFCHDLCLLI